MKGPPSFRRLFLAVLLGHGALLLFFGATSPPPPLHFRPISVRTVAPSAVKETKGKVSASPHSPSPSAPSKKPAQNTSAGKTGKSPPQKKELLQEMAKGLEALEKKGTSPSRAEVTLPAKIDWIPTLEEGSFEGGEYEEALLAVLKRGLQLPERGAVKMELLFDQEGSLLSCKVLQTKSGKNGQFLLEELPKLSFPPITTPSTSQNDKIKIVINFSNS